MRIVDVKADDLTIPYPGEVRPAWQPGVVTKSFTFTLVRIITDNGIVGVGGTRGHLAGVILSQVKPYMIGEDSFATERLSRAYRSTTAGGIWCVDMALWDIIGKAANLPLYKLWGNYHDKVKAYASAVEVGTPESRAELALHYQKLGFKAMKLRFHNETMKEDLAILDACLDATKGKMDFMVDANQPSLGPARQGVVWDLRRALQTARELETRGAIWLEEPLGRYDFDDLIRLREATEIYIAGGELNQGLHEFRWLIERGVYDIIQPDCSLAEGVSQLRKVAAMAEVYNRHFAPHHGMSGLGLAAALHLTCTFPGYTWMEMMYEPRTRTIESFQQLGGILESRIWIDNDGFVSPPNQPGLGVTLNEKMIGKYAVKS
jgi:L-alanine-DL-glutamate epimerase-like enolase superfamily enzyme